MRSLLAGTTHLLVSIPPDLEGDVVLRHFRDDLAALPDLAWVGYLSTVGVYGDWQGQWVDETSPTRPTSERSLRRVQAEQAWLAFGGESGRRVEIFRLAGIYGPGRSVIDNLRAGTAQRIVKPGQVFNRIHVDDIARVLVAAIDKAAGHTVYNVSRRRAGAAAGRRGLCRRAAGHARRRPRCRSSRRGSRGMAASFWAESKRVGNARIKAELGVELAYPDLPRGPERAYVRCLIPGLNRAPTMKRARQNSPPVVSKTRLRHDGEGSTSQAAYEPIFSQSGYSSRIVSDWITSSQMRRGAEA